MSRREAYGYAVARIRAMEHRLLDANLIQRLVDSEDVAAVFKILGETAYAKELALMQSNDRFDAVLEAELLSTYHEVQTFVPDGDLVGLCRIPYDFHNVKVLLKSGFNLKTGGKKRWDLLTSLGTLPLDNLIEQIESEDFMLLPYGLSSVLPQCVSVWEQTRDVFEVERLLDLAQFATLGKIAASLDEDGITRWSRARIDAENIRNWVRLKRFGYDANKALPFLHDGGTLSKALLLSMISEPFEGWGRMLSFSDFGGIMGHLHDTGNFEAFIVSLERLLDEYALQLLSPYKYTTDAPENILLYLWNKEMEIKNIRTVIVSKSMKADKETLRGLLRHGIA